MKCIAQRMRGRRKSCLPSYSIFMQSSVATGFGQKRGGDERYSLLNLGVCWNTFDATTVYSYAPHGARSKCIFELIGQPGKQLPASLNRKQEYAYGLEKCIHRADMRITRCMNCSLSRPRSASTVPPRPRRIHPSREVHRCRQPLLQERRAARRLP